MIQIIINLVEFFQNLGLIPTQREQMPQKVLLMLTKSVFENIKCGINWSSSKLLLFKYYVSELGGGGGS